MKALHHRVTKFSDAHPLLSIAFGLLVIVVAGLVLLPADPPELGVSTAATRGTT